MTSREKLEVMEHVKHANAEHERARKTDQRWLIGYSFIDGEGNKDMDNPGIEINADGIKQAVARAAMVLDHAAEAMGWQRYFIWDAALTDGTMWGED